MLADTLTRYEEEVLGELRAWKSPPSNRLGRICDRAEAIIDRGLGLVPTKHLDVIVERVAPVLGDITWRATSTSLVVRAYSRAGSPIREIAEIASLDLCTVDRVAGNKRARDALAGAAEGAALGFYGLPAVPADIAAVMVLSVRAAQSRGLVYGFDPRADDEIGFALQIAESASRLGPRSKSSARAGIAGVGKVAQQQVAAKLADRLPAVAARLTVMKSESAAPIIGAVTGGAFNAWYLQAVSHTARMAYRERFLAQRHGADLLAAYGI